MAPNLVCDATELRQFEGLITLPLTADIYSQITPQVARQAADRLADILVGQHTEDLGRPPLKFVARGDIVRERGPGQEERASRVQPLDVERGHLPTGRAEEDERATWSQAAREASKVDVPTPS